MQLGTMQFNGPVVMGILNVTPDSFSDGGRFIARDDALRQAEAMIAAGAAIIDIGGESTRPGAAGVTADEELARVIPVIENLVARFDVPVSIDTSKPEVMRGAVTAGATLINDVRALGEPGAVEAAAELQVPVCLMHMQGQPQTMQASPAYDDVVTEVIEYLQQRIDACVAGGLSADLLVVDPGFGFGKTPAHNMELLARLGEFRALGRPILAGLSRKSTLGELTGREVDERLPASIAAAAIAAVNGADILRVHDVTETVDALKVVSAVLASGNNR